MAHTVDFLRGMCYRENMNQQRAYKYRWYPTTEQEKILAQTFGCARYVYNWALQRRSDAYYERQERIGYQALSASLTLLKQQADSSLAFVVLLANRLFLVFPCLLIVSYFTSSYRGQ